MPNSEDPLNTNDERTPESLANNKRDDSDLAFEKEAEQAETEAALERDLEGTFPTSDPPSSWAGPDVMPHRSNRGETDESL